MVDNNSLTIKGVLSKDYLNRTIVELYRVKTLGQCMSVGLRRAPVFFLNFDRLQLDGIAPPLVGLAHLARAWPPKRMLLKLP